MGNYILDRQYINDTKVGAYNSWKFGNIVLLSADENENFISSNKDRF